MTCARCHSHKYDQISQHEYYQLFAFFNDANEANTEVARSEEALAQYEKALREHDANWQNNKVNTSRQSASFNHKSISGLRNMEQALAAREDEDNSLEFTLAELLDIKAQQQGEARSTGRPIASGLGPDPDKDKYTLVMQAPQQPLTGFRLELLTHESLGRTGPGRTAHGNFVLSEMRAYVSDDRNFKQHTRIELVAAEADFAQNKFAAEGALSAKGPFRLGHRSADWARPTRSLSTPRTVAIPIDQQQFLQIVLDQQYGGQHTIGRFRVTTLSGFDPSERCRKRSPRPFDPKRTSERTSNSR